MKLLQYTVAWYAVIIINRKRENRTGNIKPVHCTREKHCFYEVDRAVCSGLKTHKLFWSEGTAKRYDQCHNIQYMGPWTLSSLNTGKFHGSLREFAICNKNDEIRLFFSSFNYACYITSFNSTCFKVNCDLRCRCGFRFSLGLVASRHT